LKSGQIVDATFVTVPIQRNNREKNALIKKGVIPIEWGKEPHKLAQKDTDALLNQKEWRKHLRVQGSCQRGS